MKKSVVVSSCVAFVLSMSGCGIEDCVGVEEDGERLASDLGTLYRTTKTYEMAQDGGVLSVEVTYKESSNGWDALASRGAGTHLMTFLSDLLIPSAHADCGPAIVEMDLTYTARWSTVEGVSVVLAEDAQGSASYMGGAYSGDAFFPTATSLKIEGSTGTIELVSTGGSAQSFQLVRYYDELSQEEYVVTLECRAGSDDCISSD